MPWNTWHPSPTAMNGTRAGNWSSASSGTSVLCIMLSSELINGFSKMAHIEPHWIGHATKSPFPMSCWKCHAHWERRISSSWRLSRESLVHKSSPFHTRVVPLIWKALEIVFKDNSTIQLTLTGIGCSSSPHSSLIKEKKNLSPCVCLGAMERRNICCPACKVEKLMGRKGNSLSEVAGHFPQAEKTVYLGLTIRSRMGISILKGSLQPLKLHIP